MDGHRPNTYGDSFADVYDSWYGQVSDAEATADLVDTESPPGLILELGVGTGRLARPLQDKGRTVIGLDASVPMLDQCQPGPGLLLVRADMAHMPLAGSFAAVLCAFNTLFNLTDSVDQQAVFNQSARILDPSGVLVIEAITGEDLEAGPRSSVGVSTMTADQVVLSATLLDANDQTISGQHIELGESGIRLRPWSLRWITPDQMDRMARTANLRLVSRFADWDRTPFGPESDRHVSVYELAGDPKRVVSSKRP